MIIGFLGKGGSGKSSLATQVSFALNAQQKRVLAIDADHNMDFGFNLTGGTQPTDMRFLGSAMENLWEHAGLGKGDHYSKLFEKDDVQPLFHFSNTKIDPFTESHTHTVSDTIHLMSAGPQTDAVLYGKSCSHILTTPLKVYLPLLQLDDKSVVIVDEKAGADGVTTGIVTGMDVAVIVCEPAIHSAKAGMQIAKLLDFYDTPYVFVGNKIASDEDIAFLNDILPEAPVATFPLNSGVQKRPDTANADWHKEVRTLQEKLESLNRNDRLKRTKEKFSKMASFEK